MAKLKFGEGLTLGLELPKEAPKASETPKDDAPLRMPQISSSEVADEVLARIQLPTAKEVDLTPLQADMSALRTKVMDCRDEVAKIKINQHQISALLHRVDIIENKQDMPSIKQIITNRDHSSELAEMGETIDDIKNVTKLLIKENKQLKYAGMALIAAVLLTNIFNIL